ncbi:VirD4-like conjugal transfer protein, CD1115 family [Clostridium cagae]|uniref:VirD4-like conjugal transfer protein, CD1115 family n=1 Tax=Clostridium cagae TaxID=2080751 RepID=UPI003F76609A
MEYIKNLKMLMKNDNESNKEMKLLQFLANQKLILLSTLIVFFLVTILANLLSNAVIFLIGGSKSFSFLVSAFKFKLLSFPIFYIVMYSFTTILLWKVFFNFKASFRTINDGQKGTSRFTTIEELKAQYRSIPEKTEEFDGKGGVPISRYKNKIFIDDSPVNNIIIGTTRSGKGEMFIFPTIDIYSRAKEKASLIINDPKGELIAASKDILKKRGYRIELLNLLKPMNSMSYNPLQLIIDAYKKKNYSEAQSLCSTLTYTLYYDPNPKDPFWMNSAMGLVNALILAVIDECFKKSDEIEKDMEKLDKNHKEFKVLEERKDKELSKMTLYTVANMLSELGSKEDEFQRNELDNYFSKLDPSSAAKMQYATSNFSKGTARGGIFSTAMSKLQIFTLDEIAKMTSMNSINLKDIGFKNNDNEKPTALFIVTPDYDVSNHVIASIFIRQLYYVLAKESSLNDSGKCDREVIFLLDEFGNMPPIEGMANIITVCLSRGIRFNCVIQAYSQLKKLYGDDKETILGNCGNQIYILTNENETAEEFSKLIGEETIVTYSRSGEILDSTKHQTESVDSRRLLRAEELRSLNEGETVVVRALKRRDLKNNKITPRPIFNSIKTTTDMKYRYEYLSDEIDNSKSFSTVKVKSLHESVDLKELLLFNNNNENESLENSNNDTDNNRNLIVSQVFDVDEISEIRNIIRKYLSTAFEIELDTPFDLFRKFCENENNEQLMKFAEKGIKRITEMG